MTRLVEHHLRIHIWIGSCLSSQHVIRPYIAVYAILICKDQAFHCSLYDIDLQDMTNCAGEPAQDHMMACMKGLVLHVQPVAHCTTKPDDMLRMSSRCASQ